MDPAPKTHDSASWIPNRRSWVWDPESRTPNLASRIRADNCENCPRSYKAILSGLKSSRIIRERMVPNQYELISQQKLVC